MDEYRFSSDPLYLSPAHRDVLELVAAGYTNKAVATRLGLTAGAIHKRLARMMARTNAPNRTALVVVGLKVGWIRLADIRVAYPAEDV